MKMHKISISRGFGVENELIVVCQQEWFALEVYACHTSSNAMFNTVNGSSFI